MVTIPVSGTDDDDDQQRCRARSWLVAVAWRGGGAAIWENIVMNIAVRSLGWRAFELRALFERARGPLYSAAHLRQSIRLHDLT